VLNVDLQNDLPVPKPSMLIVRQHLKAQHEPPTVTIGGARGGGGGHKERVIPVAAAAKRVINLRKR
jgi:hypothetical protein